MGRMKQFAGLLAEQGKLDVPETFGVGAAYATGRWTLAADVQQIQWSAVRSLGNPGVTRASGPPGSTNGPGFGWKNQTVWKLGVAYAANNQLTVRAGYSYGTQLLNNRDGYLGMLAPSANNRHYTLGLGYDIDAKNGLSFAYARSPKVTVEGQGTAPDALASPYMGQHWFSLGYNMRF
jgi:long-chain fatty acid transport protein